MSLCVTTVVNKAYQKYIPSFCYFCTKSYPYYGIKLFLTEKLVPKYKEIVVELPQVEIIENAFTGFPKASQELKTLRWIITPEIFEGYDNIYVGDVDLLICRESQTLEDQHVKHCEEICLPYSNSVRPNSTRFSGLHFVRREFYYAEMLPIIKKYAKKLREGELCNSKNETILYNMIKESGLGFPKNWFRPHHGLHLGLWRRGPRKIEQRYWDVIDKSAYRRYYEYYLTLKNAGDSLFKEVTNLSEIVFMEKSLGEEFGGTDENTG